MKNIALIYGGKSCECDISVLTALSVYSEIKYDFRTFLIYLNNGRFFIGDGLRDVKNYHPFKEKKFKEVRFDRGCMTKKGLFPSKVKIDCALVCCHGGQGEGGALSGLLDIAGIPYTCCRPMQSGICMDKVFTKYLLEYLHLPILPYRVFRKGDDPDKFSVDQFPVIIKPATLGSSIGISIVEDSSKLKEAIEKSLLFDGKLLVEKALTDFREYTCAVLSIGGEILCGDIEEVVSPDRFYSFDEKYQSNTAMRIYPAKIDIDLEKTIHRICKKVYTCFEMKGVIRIDFLESDGEIFVNEINTVPGSLSGYLFKNKGYDMADICRFMIEQAIKSKESDDSYFSEFSSTVLTDIAGMGKGAKRE